MLVQRLTCGAEEVLLVRGPATVRTESDGWSALGAILKAGTSIVVRKNKVLPFESSRPDSSILLTLGEGADHQLSSGKVGSRIWEGVKERVFSSPPKRLLVVGENDSGKSTLTTFLINTAISTGLKVGVVDGDVGQGDLAPPCCIGSTVIKKQLFDLRDVQGEYFAFIGITSPYLVEELVIKSVDGLRKKVEEKGLDLCIINTDGYVGNGGVEYKLRLAHKLKPDIIVHTGGDEKDPLFKRMVEEFGYDKVIVAARPEEVSKRPSERSERRLAQYRNFLRYSRRMKVNLENLNVFFLGDLYTRNTYQLRSIAGTELRLGKEDDKGNVIVFDSGPCDRRDLSKGRRTTYLGSLVGRFVGLGTRDNVAGFGLVGKGYFDGTIDLFTPLNEYFDTLYLGLVRLSRDLRSESLVPLL